MNRFILFTIFLIFISCNKQSKESKANTDQHQAKEDSTPARPIKKYDPISINSKFVSKLSKKELASIFTRRKQNQLGISNTIYQAYSYKDKSGEYYLVLTDHMKTINEEKDTIYDNIYAVNASNINNQLKKRSTIKDKIDNDWETSIGFWNQYSEISDFDNDGLVDIILVYGATGQDLYTDGRIKILVYHTKKRVSIKHQNSAIEDGRITKININFYGLPSPIQEAVKEKIRLMTQNKHAFFAKDWEKEMKLKATRIE